MTAATLIYPHQLYADHPAVADDRLHVLIEDILFFGDSRYPARFHKQRLLLHRASMKRYEAETLANCRTRYIDYGEIDDQLDYVFQQLAQQGITAVHVVDPTDYLLDKRIRRYCKQYDLHLTVYPSPNFVSDQATLDEFWSDKAPDDYHQTDFYIFQRKRLGILLDEAGKPVGGRWTYDTDNRQKLKQGVSLPQSPATVDNAYVREARAYVEAHFAHNPGSTDDFIYATSHDEAAQVLQDFLRAKLDLYGPYQDAISTRGAFLFHSLLSAPFNIGLLSPGQILDAVQAYYDAHPQTTLSSVEGFVRQIIGWREFMRAVYLRAGSDQRQRNFFRQARDLDEHWYTGETGIQPIDDVIHKLNRYAYAHHIERLMLLGNFMLLCEVHPDNVYRWFMEMFIDAYDWVMVPNVYGMSQYADGGLMTTKPYISSSNYVRKMSDYGSKGTWQPVWDGLYWRFINKHLAFFKGNPRLAMMTSHLKRMGDDKLHEHQRTAEEFLAQMVK